MNSRIILQEHRRNLFYRYPDQWVPEKAEATDFKTLLDAKAFCDQNQLPPVQFLMDFGLPKHELVLRVF